MQPYYPRNTVSLFTSNVTTVTKVRRASACLFAGMWRPKWVLLQHCIMLRWLFFIVECGIACFLCAMHVFEVWVSSSSLGYLCAKFHFFCGLHCWASTWRNIAYSITQSPTQLIWCPGNWSASTSENPTNWIKRNVQHEVNTMSAVSAIVSKMLHITSTSLRCTNYNIALRKTNNHTLVAVLTD